MMLMRICSAVCTLMVALMFRDAGGYNLAYKKPTWQTNEKTPSKYAVDGRHTDISANGDTCTMSYASDEVTWLVDLEAIQSISRIVIYYRTNGESFANSIYASRFLGFSLYVSNTTAKEDGFLCYHDTSFTSASIPSEMNITCDSLGRYLIYYNSRKGYLSKKMDYSSNAFIDLCEVEVYGCPVGFYGVDCTASCPQNCIHCHYISGKCLGGCNLGFSGHSCEIYERKNLALHRPTFQLHTLSSDKPSSNLVDGRKTNFDYTKGPCTSTADQKEIAMWRVDLEYVRQIEHIVVYARTDNAKWDANNGFRHRLLGFTVVVSNTTDHTNGVICYHDTNHTVYTMPSMVDIACTAIGRYVMYYNERINGIQYPEGYSQYAFTDLCEVEVYGCPSPQHGFKDTQCKLPCIAMCKNDLVNLSYKKETWQSSTDPQHTYGTSDKAVDGGFSRNYKGCTLTSPSTKATWRVNLGKVYSIHHIVIYFRTDDFPWGYKNGFTSYYLGFFLYISNTTDLTDGVLCHHDTTYTKQTIPDHVSIDCQYTGKYVIYYNERLPGVSYPPGYSSGAYTDLCEVEVYGCPSPIANVSQCSKPCPSNCEQCYPDTGLCKKCKPGFDGVACEIACHALARVDVSPASTYNGSIYDAMISSDGFSVSKANNNLVQINIHLSGLSTNLANISFTINKTYNVTLVLYDIGGSEIKLFSDHSKDLERWKVSVENSLISKVSTISIVVHYTYPFRIWNMRLPLRKCFKYT